MDKDEYNDLLWKVNYVFFVAASSLAINLTMLILYMMKLQGGE